VELFDAGKTRMIDTTTSLTNGAYVLKAPEPGKYMLVTDAADYYLLSQPIDLTTQAAKSQNVQIRHLSTIHVKLMAPSGAADAHKNVQVWWSIGGIVNRDREMPASDRLTSTDGVINLIAPRDLPVNLVSSVVICVRDPSTGCGQKTLDEWPALPVTLPLEHGATLKGVVRDNNGKPAANATVIVVPAPTSGFVVSGRGRVSALTNDKGEFRIGALFYTTYIVRANIPGVGFRGYMVKLTKPETDMSTLPDVSQPIPHVFAPPDGAQEMAPPDDPQGRRLPFRAIPGVPGLVPLIPPGQPRTPRIIPRGHNLQPHLQIRPGPLPSPGKPRRLIRPRALDA
jgi:hypothetical protein